jgi:Na+/H+ antiporter NhaD/arsenite permease-like protein
MSLTALRGAEGLREVAATLVGDFLPFIIVIWTLYTVTGGILLRGGLTGSPASNTVLLLAGSLLASLMGTTGAAMLLVRPFLRANAWRGRRDHQAVFFIFLVCNIGGSLTPIGDPPLLLGFLHGIPFFWNLRLFPVTASAVGALLAAFYILDCQSFRHERAVPPAPERFRLSGMVNLPLLAAAVALVVLSGWAALGDVSVAGVTRPVAGIARDAGLVGLGMLSLRLTPRAVREANGFSWGPVREVAEIFPGIFVAAVPVLILLKAGVTGRLGAIPAALGSPVDYFWASGLLSSVLDNTPTFLLFFNAVLGDLCCGVSEKTAVAGLIRNQGTFLQAIAAGSVFMGANTYLGNGPNLLVRSIAVRERVAMPGFFGYIARYALPYLFPVYLLVAVLFFA